MKNAPKPLLFCDFEGTISTQRYWRSLPKDAYEKVQDLMFRNDVTMTKNWMRGMHTAEEVNEYVAEKIAINPSELWDLFLADCKSMRVDPAVLEKINHLRTRYVTILITANMDSFSRFTVPSLQLDKYFDVISNSYLERKHKTDNNGELFCEYAQKFDVPISKCVLIDNDRRVLDVFEALDGIVCPITPQKDVSYYLDLL